MARAISLSGMPPPQLWLLSSHLSPLASLWRRGEPPTKLADGEEIARCWKDNWLSLAWTREIESQCSKWFLSLLLRIQVSASSDTYTALPRLPGF